MSNEYIVSVMKDLIDELNKATVAYDAGNPIMSDSLWDKKYFHLAELEEKYGIVLDNSPTNSIHFEIKSDLNKITHEHPMLSLDKTKEVANVESFLGDRKWIAMGKMDGLTCSLTYEGGKLVRAETRGNGLVGEDILHNMLVNLSIPHKIPYLEKVVIDGEIICTYDVFHKYEKEFKNPRNFAAGSIRLLNSRECRHRLLTFVAWDVIELIELPHFINKFSLIKQLEQLEDWGFWIPATYWEDEPKEGSVEEAIKFIKCQSELFGYPIDGVVFKFDDLKLRDELGHTAHHFNNAIAFKFEDELYDTKMVDIEWTMGRTGVLTPVAVFEPVDTDDSIVSRASLHNLSVMEDTLGIPFVGQKIKIFKANMIIPQVYEAEKPKEKPNAEIIKLPEICPVCGGPVKIKENDDVRVLICDNPACQGKLINRLDHFFGIKGLNAKGISKATFEKLIEWGWIDNIEDVYNLKDFATEWKKKDGFGDKSVEKILSAIEESKNVTLEKFICALGIPLIGNTVSKNLVKQFNSYQEFRDAVNNKFDFSKLPDFGIEKRAAILSFDYTEADILATKYLNIAVQQVKETKDKLQGLTFVITGTVNKFKNRAELQKYIESLSGKVTAAISKNTNYLICNNKESTSSKTVSAKKLGIPIISEEEFEQLCVDKK